MKRLYILIGWLVLASLLAACGTATPTAGQSQAGATTTAPKSGLGNDTLQVIAEATKGGDFQEPLDSIPDGDFANIYFTAKAPNGTGVFKVPTKGGTAIAVFTGKPFDKARSIALTPDSKQLFITDSGMGQIFTLATGGGQPNVLAGSNGTSPQNITVIEQNGQNMVYFTGKDPSSGQPAVLKLPVNGANAPIVVTKGAPLVEPDGVTVTQSGTIYVADRTAAGDGFGKVFKVEGDKVTAIVDKVRTGTPAGIALTHDDKVLAVSALDPAKPNDQVLLVDLTSLQSGILTKVVGENSQAGGLHAMPSRKVSNFAWADRSKGGKGGVYAIQQQANQ